jgi:hypothetical protein
MPRFILLEHTAAPDDPAGLHYDLLLEEGEQCRTWRLATVPQPGGPDVTAVEAAPHRLAWLDHEAGEVSGGRGFARRVAAGTYEPAVCEPHQPHAAEEVSVSLQGHGITGWLRLRPHDDHWLVWLVPSPPSAAAPDA